MLCLWADVKCKQPAAMGSLGHARARRSVRDNNTAPHSPGSITFTPVGVPPPQPIVVDAAHPRAEVGNHRWPLGAGARLLRRGHQEGRKRLRAAPVQRASEGTTASQDCRAGERAIFFLVCFLHVALSCCPHSTRCAPLSVLCGCYLGHEDGPKGVGPEAGLQVG